VHYIHLEIKGNPMSTHHKYAPSGLELIEACAVFEKQDFPDTGAADEGTMMHSVLETGDRRLLETAEQEAQINKCFLILKNLQKQMGEPIEEFPEIQLEVHDDAGELVTRGTSDRGIINRETQRGIILDWKMGITPITEADTNPQLQTYVAGAFQRFPELEEITGVLCAPRQDFLSEHTYHRRDLPALIERIQNIIKRHQSPFKSPTPDETACGLCKHRAECPALKAIAITTHQGLGALPLPSEFEPGKLASPLDRAKAQVLAKILEKWAADIKRYNTLAVVEHGEEIPPGFRLSRRSGGFGINGEHLPELVSLLQTKFEDLTWEDPEFLDCFNLSISKLGTLLSDRTGKNKKDLLQVLSDELPWVLQERPDVVYLQKKSKKITDEQILSGEVPST
jgi:hypothetical protein